MRRDGKRQFKKKRELGHLLTPLPPLNNKVTKYYSVTKGYVDNIFNILSTLSMSKNICFGFDRSSLQS